tara:strand:- start:1056 stop:2279 length:1224 start_codon:yes stop_codon:yes gene_type:complete
MQKIFKIWFFLGLFIIVYLFGWNSNKYQIFPHGYLQSSITLIKDTINNSKFYFFSNKKNNIYNCKPNIPSKNIPDYSYLIVQEFCNKITKIDNEGNIIKEWLINDSILKNKKFKNGEIYPISSLLDENDNLIFSFHHNGMNRNYIAMLNKNDELKWIKDNRVHHWGTVDVEKIYFSSTEVKKRNHYKNFLDADCSYIPHYNTISIIDKKTGKILNEIDILKRLIDYQPNLNAYFSNVENACLGPLHINYVTILKNQNLSKIQNVFKGDLMISDRSSNAIYFYNIKEDKIVEDIQISFTKQHSPKILNNGNIALFDNYGGNNENGRSRIYILDPKTKKMIGSINGDNNNYFFSATRGHVHEGKVNNEFFITSSNQGIIYYSKCNDIIRECTIKNIINSNNIITDFNLY